LKKRRLPSGGGVEADRIADGPRESRAKEAIADADEAPESEVEQRDPRSDDRRRHLPRRPIPNQRSHHEPEIERGNVSDISLARVVSTSQPYPPMPARLTSVREGPLDPLAA
jgi:hypothetical protein